MSEELVEEAFAFGNGLKAPFARIVDIIENNQGTEEALHILDGQARQSIGALFKFSKNSETKKESIRLLYWLLSNAVEKLNAIDDEDIRAMAREVTSWPISVSPRDGNWVKTRMPAHVRKVLHEIELGTSPRAYPIKGIEDYIGKKIKLQFWRLNEFVNINAPWKKWTRDSLLERIILCLRRDVSASSSRRKPFGFC